VVFRLTKEDSFRLRLSIAWAFGLLSKDLGKATDKPVTSKPKTKKSSRKQPQAGRGKARTAIVFMRSPGMPARLLRLTRDVWRQLRVRQLYLHLTFGLDDPADTGQLFGALAPALIQADRLSRLDLQVHPDFSQPILLVNGRGQVRVIPLAIIGAMIAFLMSPTCWRGFVAAAKANKS
jgi:hypothetical protein